MRISLRWRLTLLSWSAAFGTALVLGVLIHFYAQRQLLGQLEKTLETKCDEVITVLETADSHTLQSFLRIETSYRFSPADYFYVVRDGRGGVLARSENLGGSELPIPEDWRREGAAGPIRLLTEPHPTAEGGRIRVRSERVEVRPRGAEPATVVIQTAVSLGPFEQQVARMRLRTCLVAAGGLGAVLFLLWFVTTRALRPVAAMTKRVTRITAANPRERLPVSRRGDELDELATVLNDMLDRLAVALRQMEQFSSDAAHQLRTPLTRIRGELDLVLRTEVPEPPRSQLERMQQELERLSRLCARLLLLARLDQQAREASLLDERVDLETVVSELLEEVAPAAHERGVCVRRGTTATALVRGSRPLLVEALLNLLDNAVRYTPEGGRVVVSIAKNGAVVRLGVQDGGPGVPHAERERIFQRFYRIRHAAPGFGPDDGSGLGLPIVRGIARAHGGCVELEEVPGGGSLFSLVLPLTPTAGGDETAAVPPMRAAAS